MAIKLHYIALVVVFLMVIQGFGLYMLNRNFTCPCGIALWNGTSHPIEDSQQIFDWYSLVHVSYGIVAYFLARLVHKKVRWPMVLFFALIILVSVGWELYENTDYFITTYGHEVPEATYYGDSIVNSLSDTFTVAVGFTLALLFPWWLAVAIALAIEILVHWKINDGVIISTMLFFRPIASLIDWRN